MTEYKSPLMNIIELPDDTFDIRLALVKSNTILEDNDQTEDGDIGWW